MSKPRTEPCIDGCGTPVAVRPSRSGRCNGCSNKLTNDRATEAARQRLLAAIEEMPTLRECMEAYGRARNTFWRAVRQYDLVETVHTKYAEDLAEDHRRRALLASQAALKGRDVANARAAERKRVKEANLVEDADWLARTGEHPANAFKRLGYKNFEALDRALDRAGRPDLTIRLLENDGLLGLRTNGA